MKMAAKSVKNLNEKLVCAVCLNTLKNPKLLACFHAFCEQFLKQKDQIEVFSGELKCLGCSKVTDLPGECMAGLKWNPLFFRLLEALEAKKQASQIKCDACGDSESPLTTYCRDCFSFICDSCASYHGKMKLLLKVHHTIPLDKIINGTIKIKWMEEGLWRKTHECGEHNGELLRFYCRTCKKRICRDCIVLDHTKPDHDCTTMQKMLQETQEMVKDRLKSCKEEEERVGTMLNVRETETKQKCHMMKQRIRELKSTAVENLNKPEEELLQKIEGSKLPEQMARFASTVVPDNKPAMPSLIQPTSRSKSVSETKPKHMKSSATNVNAPVVCLVGEGNLNKRPVAADGGIFPFYVKLPQQQHSFTATTPIFQTVSDFDSVNSLSKAESKLSPSASKGKDTRPRVTKTGSSIFKASMTL